MYKTILIFIYFLFSMNLLASQSKGTFKLIKYESDYYLPVQNNIIYPNFEKQPDRQYIILNKCKYKKVHLNHNLSLKKRSKKNILFLTKEVKKSYLYKFNDKEWTAGKLPDAVNKYPDKYQDGVLYRIKVFIPIKYKNKVLKLFFLGANYIVDVWINEKWIGSHEGGYTSFAYDISKYVNYGKTNILFVRLDNIPWLNTGYDNANKHDIVPYKKMDWWNYTGINRDVYIEVSEKIHIARTDLKYTIDKNKCSMDFYIDINNASNKESKINISINLFASDISGKNILSLNAEGLINREKKIFSKSLKNIKISAKKYSVVSIKDINVLLLSGKTPKNTTYNISDSISLWSPASPKLYVLEVILKNSKNKIIEKNYYQVGFRDLKIKKQKIYLNGVRTLFKGTAYHEEFYPDGRVISEPTANKILENLYLVKELNANFLRTAHYPQHFFTYLLTDRLGLAVWEEIPVMWFDGPEFVYQIRNRKIPQQMLLEMLYANYNSPSVLFHGLCNESGWRDERIEYLWKMKKLGKKVKPDRLYAQSAVGSDMTDITHRDMDIFGATMYYGVFYWSDAYKHTLYALNKMHLFFPDKPIIATEYGVWSGEDNSNEYQQIKIAEDTYRAFTESKVVSGMVWWALIDWYTMITGIQTMGLISMDKKYIKPAFMTLQRLYGNDVKNYKINIINIKDNQKVRGKIKIRVKINPLSNIQTVQYAVNGLNFSTMNLEKYIYTISVNTEKLKEGKSFIIIRMQLFNNEVLYKKLNIIVDNYDNAPQVSINLENNKMVMDNYFLKVKATDDGKITMCKFKIDNGKYAELNYRNSYYSTNINFSNLKNNSKHRITIFVKDDGKHTIETNINYIYNSQPDIKIELPYDLDRIAYKTNIKDVYFWGFPAEELPPSNKWSISEKGNAKFFMPDKSDGKKNVMVCMGQYIKVKKGKYSNLYVFGYSYWGNQNNDLILYYNDGSKEIRELKLGEWTGGMEQFNNHLAYFCTKHYESNGKIGDPPVAFYYADFPLNKKKILTSIEFPDDTHKHVIAATLKK